MNKLYNFITTTIVLASINTSASAAMHGHYVVGKSSEAAFVSITDAVAAVEAQGVNGAVSFMIESGIYKEQIIINPIKGASAANTINFTSKAGSAGEAVISAGNNDATIVIRDASYINFENITIDHKEAIAGHAVRVDGKAGHLNFRGTIFNGIESTGTGAANAVVYFTGNDAKTDIAFSDCEINDGSIGILKSGTNDSKTFIHATLFYNQYEAALALSNENSPQINDNTINSFSELSGFKGISLDNTSGNVLISGNIITIANGSFGIVMNNCKGGESKPGEISNNSIAVGSKDEAYGIYFSGSTDNQSIYNNRVKLSCNQVSAAQEAYFKNIGTGAKINLTNNSVFNLKSGGYTLIGTSYEQLFEQSPSQTSIETNDHTELAAAKVSSIK